MLLCRQPPSRVQAHHARCGPQQRPCIRWHAPCHTMHTTEFYAYESRVAGKLIVVLQAPDTLCALARVAGVDQVCVIAGLLYDR